MPCAVRYVKLPAACGGRWHAHRQVDDLEADDCPDEAKQEGGTALAHAMHKQTLDATPRCYSMHTGLRYAKELRDDLHKQGAGN